MDALHFQESTLDLIVNEKCGEALIGLKGNNKNILTAAIRSFESAEEIRHLPLQECKGHGRYERRSLDIIAFRSELEKCNQIRSVIRVLSSRRKCNSSEWTNETRYFIATFPFDRYTPEKCLMLVRGHWHIENKLHHVKDRSMHEDRCTAQGNTAANLALLRSIIVLFKQRVTTKRYFPDGGMKGNADQAIALLKRPIPPSKTRIE